MGDKKCRCEWLMLAALGAGAALGLVGGLSVGWNGAKYPNETSFILSLLTVFGTVGATITALFFGLADQRQRRGLREQRLTSVLWLIDEAVQSAEWIGRHLTHHLEPCQNYEHEKSIEDLQAFSVSMESINQIPFHEEHYSEAHREMVRVLSMLRSLALLISPCIEKKPEIIQVKKICSLATLARENLNLSLNKDPFRGLPAPGPMYF